MNLNKNKLSDISSLKKLNFKELKELYLYYNDIHDLILDIVKFEKLEILDFV